MEEILNGLLLCAMAVDQVFGCASEHDLAGYGDLGVFFETDGGEFLVAVVEYYCYAGFCYACLAAFVDEVLIIQVESERNLS